MHVLRVIKKSGIIDDVKTPFVPVSQKLVVVNDMPITDNQRLEVGVNLLGEVEVTDSKGVVVSLVDDELTALDDLTFIQQGGWKQVVWPFSK